MGLGQNQKRCIPCSDHRGAKEGSTPQNVKLHEAILQCLPNQNGFLRHTNKSYTSRFSRTTFEN